MGVITGSKARPLNVFLTKGSGRGILRLEGEGRKGKRERERETQAAGKGTLPLIFSVWIKDHPPLQQFILYQIDELRLCEFISAARSRARGCREGRDGGREGGLVLPRSDFQFLDQKEVGMGGRRGGGDS